MVQAVVGREEPEPRVLNSPVAEHLIKVVVAEILTMSQPPLKDRAAVAEEKQSRGTLEQFRLVEMAGTE